MSTKPNTRVVRARVSISCLAAVLFLALPIDAGDFQGKYVRGSGDVEYLELLDISRRMFEPDSEFQNLSMFYMPSWNGLVEGPTWDAWWIQNSYGPTYCAMPFWGEPFRTFIANSHDLWFSQMGDGKRSGANGWVAPDGCLCDAARPGWIYYRQGDGRIDIHDWGMEFTAAGVLLQAELLLITRDAKALAHYLPRLERSADFIESRRDPKNHLFLAGAAGNLLAPSHAGWKRPDGTYDKSYLAGLSVTHIAALDRLISLERLAGRPEKAEAYAARRDLAKGALPLLVAEEGYFIKSLDPDGTRHGVHGAPKHGYFEAVVNHDAVALRVADDALSERIYAKIASIPGLRPVDLIITNHPSLDDMYEAPQGLWGFGTWVNGGHWSTCEARMILAYFRLGKYEDARRSMQRLMTYARAFRMDNPLTKFGADVYQNLPINCVYDNYGIPAALLRGLFEYLYSAETLTLIPHVPEGITRLEQSFPARWGEKRIWISTEGSGPVTSVTLNGRPWKGFDAKRVVLEWKELPDEAEVRLGLGGAPPPSGTKPARVDPPPPRVDDAFWASPWISRGFAPPPNPFRVGADSNGGSRFRGDIRLVRIWRRVLEAAAIRALAQGGGAGSAGPAAADAALAGEWLLGELQDGTVPDTTGRAAPLSVVGTLTVVEAPGGRAARFTGEGYLEAKHSPSLELDRAYTLEAWIRPGALPEGGGRIIDKSTVGTSDNYLLDTHPANSLRLITRRGTASHDAKLVPEAWVHVAASFSLESGLCLYVGGEPVLAKPADRPGDPNSVVSGADLKRSYEGLHGFLAALSGAGLGSSYEAAHARLALESFAVCAERARLLESGKLAPLPAASVAPADKSYVDTATRIADGLSRVIESYRAGADPAKKPFVEAWTAAFPKAERTEGR